MWKVLRILDEHASVIIAFDSDEFGEEVHVMSVDTVNFIVNEPRDDPGKKWFDKKSASAGKFVMLVLTLMAFY